MAGIGFPLRRMAQSDVLAARIGAFGHGVVVSAGPWLLSVISVGLLEVGTRSVLAPADWALCSALVVYIFSFSLVLSGPIVMVLTRHVADELHAGRVASIPSHFVGGLCLTWMVLGVFDVVVVLGMLGITLTQKIVFIIGFHATGGIWMAGIFLTTLKDYRSITLAFLGGLATSLLGGVVLAHFYGGTGALAGFVSGLVLVFFLIAGRILATFPYPVTSPFSLMGAFRTYWQLAWAGFFYNLAIWIDKWVMWLAPQGRALAPGVFSNPAYDGSMFLAYLVTVPALTLFLVSVETGFYERYIVFYRAIQQHATFAEIRRNHQEIVQALVMGGRNIAVVEGVICYLALLVAPGLIGLAKGGLELVPIFRFGVLGVFFHTLLLFAIVIASYFDLRKITFQVTLVFLLTNALLTAIFLPMGAAYAGYGYFLASLITFLFAYLSVSWCVKRLPYMTFIGNNPGLH